MKLSRLNMNTKCYSTCHDVTLSILNRSFYFLAVVVCDPPCENGICVANDTCNCTIGYEGERCSDSTEKSLFTFSRFYLQMLHSTAEKVLMIMGYSLIPRSPPILPSICIHSNTRGWESGKKWGRLGSIHHVSGREKDKGEGGEGGVGGGRGPDIQILYILSLKGKFADQDK